MKEVPTIEGIIQANDASLLDLKMLRNDLKEVRSSEEVEAIIASALNRIFSGEAEAAAWEKATIDALEWVRQL